MLISFYNKCRDQQCNNLTQSGRGGGMVVAWWWHGGGMVVIIFAFYSNDPSSSPACTQTIINKEAGVIPFKKVNKLTSLATNPSYNTMLR